MAIFTLVFETLNHLAFRILKIAIERSPMLTGMGWEIREDRKKSKFQKSSQIWWALGKMFRGKMARGKHKI